MKSKNVALTFFGVLSLACLPILSYADSCSDIKEQYWNCVRSSMSNGSCESNVSIPPECLKAGGESSSSSSGSSSSSSSGSGSGSNFFDSIFGSKKEEAPFVYQADLPPKKPVKLIDIKPMNGKIYFETEEEVNQYTTKVKDDMSAAIKDGKRVRLQFQ